MKHCDIAWLVGLDYELPADRSVANTEDTLPIVGCNHVVCGKCGANVKNVIGRSVTSHLPPLGPLGQAYDSPHPEQSSIFAANASDGESRTYYCRCAWRTVTSGKLPMATVDAQWYCEGHA